MVRRNVVDDSVDIGVTNHDGPRPRPAAENRGDRRRWLLAAVVAAVCIAAGLVLARPTSTPTNPTAPDPVAANPANADHGDSGSSEASEATPGESLAADPIDTTVISDTVRIERSGRSEPIDQLLIVDGTDHLIALDLNAGTRTNIEFPEPLTQANPVRVGDAVVVLGETNAWVTSPRPDALGWSKLGPADRIRYSTISDRVWLRSINDKTDPTDAEFLWNEVDLAGDVQRSMFRNRPVWFPTPEFILGLGSNVFRFTDAEINPWRLFSPFGVPMAVGRNDLIARECNTRIECENVWYDVISGERRPAIYQDLADQIDGSYGTLLSPDGRFLISELRRPTAASLAFIRSVTTGRVVANNCLWESPVAWSSDSLLFACRSADGIELHQTAPSPEQSRPLALRIAVRSEASRVSFAFVSSDTDFAR